MGPMIMADLFCITVINRSECRLLEVNDLILRGSLEVAKSYLIRRLLSLFINNICTTYFDLVRSRSSRL